MKTGSVHLKINEACYLIKNIVRLFWLNHMKPICFIPARGDSKEIPRKNIKPLGGKPLIAHTIESALRSNIFDHVIVSTDDQEIAQVSKQNGAEIPFMRPKELANDTTSTDAVLLHGIKQLYSLGYQFEILVLRDCTVPFITEDDMKGAIEVLQKSGCDGVFAAIKAHPNPYFGMMEINSKGYLEISKSLDRQITRRQDAPVVYEVDGLFVINVKRFLCNEKMFTSKILPYEISKEHGHMIDFEFDFKIAELLCNDKMRQREV